MLRSVTMPIPQSIFRRTSQSFSLVATALLATACAATPVKRPSAPLVSGEPSWPEEIADEAERADRLCGNKEAQLLYDHQEGKEEQQNFKTIMGSITGGVGTVGGV